MEQYITPLTPDLEIKIKKLPFFNIDTYIIPSPYIRDKDIDKDYKHSYVWSEKGEIMGYILVYSNHRRKVYHIYKQVTSPFGRGKGIGSSFLERLATEIPPESLIYLYVWEKQLESIDFFESKGFRITDNIVYRELSFKYMEVSAGILAQTIAEHKEKQRTEIQELNKTRHDARKNLHLIMDMVNMLSVNNCYKIIEDINRETTALINMLNSYNEKISSHNIINLKELIVERIIPFIEVCGIPCEIQLSLKKRISTVMGHYVEIGRALINLLSNSVDAIKESGRHGVIEISLDEIGDRVILEIKDNGVGFRKHLLKRDKNNIPLFVGKTEKSLPGEGLGTKQIFDTFGAENIAIESEFGKYAKWRIQLPKAKEKQPPQLLNIEERYYKLMEKCKKLSPNKYNSYEEMEKFIIDVRALELLSYDIIFQFSKYNNIRDIYRNILSWRFGKRTFDFLKQEIIACKADIPELKQWLLDIMTCIKNYDEIINTLPFEKFAGVLFKSYGQNEDATMIFTLDPDTGRFFCTDRKLAEHMDFVAYLNKDRDELVRGEFNGKADNSILPIRLGVWSLKNEQDITEKIFLIIKSARILLDLIGLPAEKRIRFYHTTYNESQYEFDISKIILLKELAAMDSYTPSEIMSELIINNENDDLELTGIAFAD